MSSLNLVSADRADTHPVIVMTTTVDAKDAVGAVVEGMPMVAATPYLVTIAEIACYRLAEGMLEAGQITVGSRVCIDHLGPSKVGAALTVKAKLRERNKNRFHFDVEIHDGERLVASVDHTRAAVLREKMMSALS